MEIIYLFQHIYMLKNFRIIRICIPSFRFFCIKENERIFNVFSVVNDTDCHQVAVRKIRQQFWCDKEILTLTLLAGDIDEHLEDLSFVLRIHSLINLVYTAKRYICDMLQT